jgi:hemerythrin-like domain-containing protein
MHDESASPFKTAGPASGGEAHDLAQTLIRIHRVITRGVQVARKQTHAVAGGSRLAPALAAGFADYLQALASVVHGHHTGEDEVAFPALRTRFDDVPWDLLSEEHRIVAPILADLESHAARIRQQPSVNDWARPAAALDRLDDLWQPHHEREEAYFSVQAVARLVAADEQATLVTKMGAHAEQHSGPPYLVVPFVLYNLDGRDRELMGVLFPPVVTKELVPVVWQDKWSPMKPFLLG